MKFKIMVFWYVTPFAFVASYECCVEIRCPHLQDQISIKLSAETVSELICRNSDAVRNKTSIVQANLPSRLFSLKILLINNVKTGEVEVMDFLFA
jgi:hypothetical protein